MGGHCAAADIANQHFCALPADQRPARPEQMGKLAIQKAMNQFAPQAPPRIGVLLFEDDRIARSSFLLPTNCRKISTRAAENPRPGTRAASRS